tara:strand:+ start:5435 stop:5977 length:543 start_codon:yes stop_codon:yes gene_type:complete
MFKELFDDGHLLEYIAENLKDPWKETPFEGYVYISPKQKGEFGERFVAKYFEEKGSNVEKASSATAGYDRLIDGYKTEIKFSIATRSKHGGVKKDSFIINHVSMDKEWERLVFIGINKNEENIRAIWFTKEDFIKNTKSEEPLFAYQQGGRKIKNDDFICTGKKVKMLLESNWVKSADEW